MMKINQNSFIFITFAAIFVINGYLGLTPVTNCFKNAIICNMLNNTGGKCKVNFVCYSGQNDDDSATCDFGGNYRCSRFYI